MCMGVLKQRWWGRLGWTAVCVVALGWMGGCSSRDEVSQGVQLVLNPASIEPTTTFELRFDEPMVSASEVGRTNAVSPLVIRPAIAGSFVWLSQRSGVYTPSEPPRLATIYRLSVAPGRQRPDGQRSTARLCQYLRTPGLQVIAPRDPMPSTDAHPVPRIQLAFNVPVLATEAAGFLRFRCSDGGEVPAEVRQATADEFLGYRLSMPWPLAGEALPLTWAQRFTLGRAGTSTNPPAGLLLEPDRGPASPVAHVLTVLPTRPLMPGSGWELVIEPGLSSPETGTRLPARLVVPVGDVEEFRVKAVLADSGLNSGRKVLIEFSKPLSPELTPTNVLEWIEVSPQPANLRASLAWSSMTVHGDFRLDETYAVGVRAGLTASDGISTARAHSAPVKFSPLPPRLYFPEFATDQMSEGKREFSLLALNVDRVQVRAKRIDPAGLVHALRGYGSYFGVSSPLWLRGERYAALDYNLLPGRTVFTRDIVLSNRVDATEVVPLRWDDVLGAGQRGALFVEAEQEVRGEPGTARVGTQALIQLTDLGLAWKRSPKGVSVRLFSYATGQGIPGGRIECRTRENEPVATGTTDGAGLGQLATGLKEADGLYLLAETPEDLRATELGSSTLSPYSLGLDWDELAYEEPSARRAMLFSDRPVYRPGETVHLKGMLRERREGRLAVPSAAPVRLRWFNARDQLFLETNLTASAGGAVDLDVVLPRASQGEYRAELSWEETSFSHPFIVRDFRPNAFEICLAGAAEYAAGEPVRVGVTAHYLLGQPLSKGKVSWSLDLEAEPFQPEGYEAFSFCSQAGGEDEEARSGSLQGQDELAGEAGVALAPQLASEVQRPHPVRAKLTVEVTDLNQQTLSAQSGFVQHSSSYYLGIPSCADVLHAGDTLDVRVIAVKPDGRPWEDAVEAEVQLEHVRWQTVRVEDAGRVVGYRSERETTLIGEQTVRNSGLVIDGEAWGLDPARTATVTFPLEQAGQYRLVARSLDPAEREVLTEVEFYVTGRDSLAWDYRNDVQLELVPDELGYQAGDTASILVKAPFGGEAWVTVERETVLRSFVTRLEGNSPAIQIPIKSDDAPNVFVSVLLLRGANDNPKQIKAPEYRLGYVRLDVEAPETHLDIEVKTDAAEVRPGQSVGVTATVRDRLGALVPGAELTVFAVDEGVLNLTGFETPDPHAHFFSGEPLAVQTGMTISQLLSEEPGQWRYHNKGYIIGGGGQLGLRRDFRACAYWNAHLVSDSDGRVRAEFPAPDSLTRYRVMAVAHTARSQFGRGEATFQVNKPLMIEPAVPSIARVGDRLAARAVVLNRTDRGGEVEVVLRLDDHAVLSGQEAGPIELLRAWTNRVSVPAQGARAVDAPLEFVRAGRSEWLWSARRLDGAGEGSAASGTRTDDDWQDLVRTEVAVGYPVPLLREIHLAQVRHGATNLLAAVNPQLLEGEGTATVRVSGSRLGELGEAVSRLLHYPYGCVEQTASSLLPWLVLDEAASSWLPTTNRAEDIQRAIRGGVDRLWSLQTYSGGLGYWPGSREATLWGSAYGAMALTLAQRRGAVVNAAAFDALLTYLKEQVVEPSRTVLGTGLNDRCLALYALALAGSPARAHHESLFDQRVHLSSSGRAWLALAMVESDGSPAQVAELLRTQTAQAGPAWDAFESAASEAGARLLAWSRSQPESSEVNTLVTELTTGMREGHWGSTQGNAWALLGLAEYARRVEATSSGWRGQVEIAGRPEPLVLSDRNQVVERSLAWSTSATPSILRLVAEGEATLFTQTVVESQPRVWTQPRQDRGFGIERAYHKLDDGNRLCPAQDLVVGDRILVSLTIEVRQFAQYVVVDDPLPCLFQAVHPEFQSQGARTEDALTQEWVSDHRELRADRAVFFCDRLSPGSYVIRYLARVRAAGAVSAPAAKVEEMYRPERFGLTETGRIEARSR